MARFLAEMIDARVAALTFGPLIRELNIAPGCQDARESLEIFFDKFHAYLSPLRLERLVFNPLTHVSFFEDSYVLNLELPQNDRAATSLQRCIPQDAYSRLLSLPAILCMHIERCNVARAAQFQKDRRLCVADPLLRLKAGLADESERRYCLFGVVVHHGDSVAGGHYTSYFQSPQAGMCLSSSF
jgi:hypothetical protein